METYNYIWNQICEKAREYIKSEHVLAEYLSDSILNQDNFAGALSSVLAFKLKTAYVTFYSLYTTFYTCAEKDPRISKSALADLQAIFERDPATTEYIMPFLFFKGYHAIQSYRFANYLWKNDQKILASFLQNRISELFGVDIHPAARIGKGILLDHATGVVVGETAVVEDNVSILHQVTLGGTGKDIGDRHPKIDTGVLIGAGAKLLGNIRIGEGAKVGAGSVVLQNVPPYCTAVGVPARIVHKTHNEKPAYIMDHML